VGNLWVTTAKNSPIRYLPKRPDLTSLNFRCYQARHGADAIASPCCSTGLPVRLCATLAAVGWLLGARPVIVDHRMRWIFDRRARRRLEHRPHSAAHHPACLARHHARIRARPAFIRVSIGETSHDRRLRCRHIGRTMARTVDIGRSNLARYVGRCRCDWRCTACLSC